MRIGASREVSREGEMDLSRARSDGVPGDLRRLRLMSSVRKEEGSGGASPSSMRMSERSAEDEDERFMWVDVRVRL